MKKTSTYLCIAAATVSINISFADEIPGEAPYCDPDCCVIEDSIISETTSEVGEERCGEPMYMGKEACSPPQNGQRNVYRKDCEQDLVTEMILDRTCTQSPSSSKPCTGTGGNYQQQHEHTSTYSRVAKSDCVIPMA